MHERFWTRSSSARSDNRKSKIQNLKLVGVVAIVVTLAIGGAGASAQQTGKVFRIGRLDVSTASGGAVLWEAFRKELSKLGWIEGKNITIEWREAKLSKVCRFAEQKFERLPELAAELVRLKVDLIVATGRAPALAAKSTTATIPIVTIVPDPVGEGLVASLARRQCHQPLEFIPRAKWQKTRDTQGHSRQARPSWIPAAGGRSRPPTERSQGCGSGTEVRIGGDQHATHCRRNTERLSNRTAEAD